MKPNGKRRKQKPVWRAAVDDFVAAVKAEYGERLKSVILFGSYARGDATRDSDVDVMVVLDRLGDYWTEAHRLWDLAYAASAGAGRWDVLLSARIAAAEDYRIARLPLHRNVQREGKVLA
jgi:predicted nucleotidyltransferase